MSHQCRVLVVEDTEDSRELLELVLLSEGCVVQTSPNGQHALELLRAMKQLPDLVLLDLAMPVMDGWSFLVELRADPVLRSIPVILTTAADPELAPRGSDGFLPKPIELAALKATLARWC